MIIGLRSAALSLLLASASLAPFQCSSEVDPNKKREEEPGEALYGLAEEFKTRGDGRARAETLRYIIKKYPTSRFAERARLDLAETDQGQ